MANANLKRKSSHILLTLDISRPQVETNRKFSLFSGTRGVYCVRQFCVLFPNARDAELAGCDLQWSQNC